MDHPRATSTAPTLHTDRLILRAQTVADFDAVARLWADPDVVRFISGQPHGAADSWARLLRQIGHWTALGYGYWAVIERASGAYIGQAGFADHKRGIDPAFDGLPEAGWVLMPDAHGRGLASEAMAAAVRWADEVAAWPRSFCILDPHHRASERVAEKAGFARVGIFPWNGGDTLVMDRSRG